MTCCIVSASKWLVLPIAAGLLMVFFIYLPFDTRFHLARLGFPVCPTYTAPKETQNYNGPSLHPVILEFLHLISYPPALLLAIDKPLLSCITNSTVCGNLMSKKSFQFATSPLFSICFPETRGKSGIWKKETFTEHILYQHISNISFYVVFMEDRNDYWYFPVLRALNQDPFAILKPNLKNLHISLHMRMEIPSDIPYFLWQLERSRFIQCNKPTAESFKKNYDFYQKSPLINDSAVLNLASFRNVLHSLRISSVLFGGTLLGWYRECGIIPYTTDLDLAAFASEYTQELITKLKWNARLQLYWLLGKPTDSLELSVYAEGVKIDLFFVYNQPNASWVGGMIVYNRTKLRWTYPRLDVLCSADLLGHLFFVPCKVEEFLSADYGPRWDIPHHDAKFVWYKSHNNVRTVGRWPLKEWRKVYRTRF